MDGNFPSLLFGEIYIKADSEKRTNDLTIAPKPKSYRRRQVLRHYTPKLHVKDCPPSASNITRGAARSGQCIRSPAVLRLEYTGGSE